MIGMGRGWGMAGRCGAGLARDREAAGEARSGRRGAERYWTEMTVLASAHSFSRA